jgi:RNA polymerase sigma-70 factor, ECF subfamily
MSPECCEIVVTFSCGRGTDQQQMATSEPRLDDQGELALARRCAAGDALAQRQLFHLQRQQVHRTLFRILGSNRQIEDLIQDTFVAVFDSLGSFRGESSLSTWITTIAARICYRHLSRREPRAAHLYPVADLPSLAADPERQAVSREAVRRLYAVLDRIDPKYRIAYTLHVLDDRPIKEVARITRTTSLAVKTRVWRARQMLQARAERDPSLAELLSHAQVAR